MSRPSEPFNAEERDLAQRLARLGGPREPAAALDAMILAAARAAVSDTATPTDATPAEPQAEPLPVDPKVTPLRPRKPAPRWPVGFGLAASVVLAAGIGWRLQIDGDTHSEAASAPAPAFHEEATEAVMLEPPLQRTPPPPPPPLDAGEMTTRRADMARAPAAKASAAPREAEFVADAVAPQSVMAEAPPPPAPPAPASTAIGGSPAADTGLDEVTVTGSRLQRERATGAAEYTRTPLNERREQAAQAAKSSPPAATSPGRAASPAAPPPPASSERARGLIGNVESDVEEHKFQDKARKSDGYDDRPPVSADSPEFRQAWLQRIRAQIAKGDTDAARNGLQEFRRRYPDLELPEDLRKLAATLPPPTP